MEILREHPGVFVPPNKGTAFFTRLYEFIGADPHFAPRSLHQRVNVNGRARRRAADRCLNPAAGSCAP